MANLGFTGFTGDEAGIRGGGLLRRHGSGARLGAPQSYSSPQVGVASRIAQFGGRRQRSRDRYGNSRPSDPGRGRSADYRPTGPMGAQEWSEQINDINDQLRHLSTMCTRHGAEIARMQEIA